MSQEFSKTQKYSREMLQQPQRKESTRRSSQKSQETSALSSLVTQVPQGQQQPKMPNSFMDKSFTSNAGGELLLGPQPSRKQGWKTLILDLDETLVHSQFKYIDTADITLPIEIEGQINTIFVQVRPYVQEFLRRMNEKYEIVVFTASLSKYAEPLMVKLDPQGFCKYKLFREHCTLHKNAYVKDLKRLGRSMKDVIIVDNSPIAYLFQPENALPAVSWYDDRSDKELLRLANILDRLVYEDDVRKVLRTLVQNDHICPKQEQLYLSVPTKPKRDNTTVRHSESSK